VAIGRQPLSIFNLNPCLYKLFIGLSPAPRPPYLHSANKYIDFYLSLRYSSPVYKIVFTKEADKALRKMPRDRSSTIRDKLAQLARDPYAPHNNVTQLQNRPGYRLRVGDWRIIYEIQNEQSVILVLRIAPRGEVYR
jgi:mRNA interferase RelE/StbE